MTFLRYNANKALMNLGQDPLFPDSANDVNPIVGAVIYYLVYQVIIFVGFDTDLLKMFSALVVAAFLGVPYVKKQLARKHHVKGGIRHA